LTGTNGQERRRAVRARIHELEASLEEPSEVLVLSTGGMAVRLPHAPEIGSRHEFTVELEGHTLEVVGVVRNVRLETDGFHEVGVEFMDMSAEQARRLEEFVTSRQPRR
jgi:c-di-GMP-binding flagellar brake protein YcgR